MKATVLESGASFRGPDSLMRAPSPAGRGIPSQVSLSACQSSETGIAPYSRVERKLSGAHAMVPSGTGSFVLLQAPSSRIVTMAATLAGRIPGSNTGWVGCKSMPGETLQARIIANPWTAGHRPGHRPVGQIYTDELDSMRITTTMARLFALGVSH